MNQISDEAVQRKFVRNIYRTCFLLMALQGLLATFLLLRTTSDPKSAVLFGLSLQRLVLIFVALIPTGCGGYLFIKTQQQNWIQSCDRQVQHWLLTKQRWSKLVVLSIGIIIIGSIPLLAIYRNSFQILAPPDQVSNNHSYFVYLAYESAKAYLIRLQPLLLLCIGLSIQTIIAIPLIRFGIRPWYDKLKTEGIFIIFSVFGIFLTIWGFLGWSDLELTTDSTAYGWYPLGTPILDVQVLLIFCIGLALLVIGTIGIKWSKSRSGWDFKNFSGLRVDLLIGLMFWLFAAFYWVSIPASENWFSSAPRFPNFEPYPNSDATLYDTNAHNLLTGMGFRKYNEPIGRRPVYTVFLASLYTIVGENYQSVTLAQSAIFAIFPGLIYLLTSILHNRLSGVVAALLIMVREANAIFLVNKITVTNSKLLMSEMPATIGVVLFVGIAILWFTRFKQSSILPLIVGGILGVAMQIRIEVGVFLPVVFLFTGIIFYRQPKAIFRGMILISFGVILFLAPWVWRNWEKTGNIFLESPGNRLGYFMRHSGLTNQLPSMPSEYQDTEAIPDDTTVRAAFFENLLSHYTYNQVQAILIFPDAYRLFDALVGFSQHNSMNQLLMSCCSRENYINRFEFWTWRKWDNSLPSQSTLPILVTLLLISIGIVKVWARNGIIGLFPLVISLGHYLVSSAVRISGGRFVHIVEWVWIIYYSVGVCQIIIYLFVSVNSSAPAKFWVSNMDDQKTPPVRQPGSRWTLTMGVGLLILFLGASLPLAETLIKPHYTEHTKQQMLAEILQSETIQRNYPELLTLMNRSLPGEGVLFQGRALYPRYYDIGEGEPGGGLGLAPSDEAHFYFFLVGWKNLAIHIPLTEQPVIEFPNAADVLVFGCQTQNGYEPIAVFINSPENILLRSNGLEIESCNLFQEP